MSNPVIIDISHHNPTPNWAQLKQGGTVGVIHKATEGNGYVDNELFSRAGPAMQAGLLWSTYHFLRPSSDMSNQIQHYLDTIDPVEGERVCLDHEDAGVSLANLEECVNIIRGKRPDLKIAIYSGHVIKEQLDTRYSAVLASTSLWIAHYTSAAAPTWPNGTWSKWDLWQYTDRASVSGLSQPVDGDRFNGSAADAVLWFGKEAGPQPGPEPGPEPKQVVIDITADDGVQVIVQVNGDVITSVTSPGR